ncbi:hypothetical protein E2C01_011239 [Portunus trituberculatus]|uniref:Uncharacterized protein n=1 Tax=Portunus trituberculatus TaxID=210409 RepID=A0A5B7DAK8_PORTR|nr:hypothetical protein [Portunus trituberculatus]
MDGRRALFARTELSTDEREEGGSAVRQVWPAGKRARTKSGGSGLYSTRQVRLMVEPVLMCMSGPPRMCVCGSVGEVPVPYWDDAIGSGIMKVVLRHPGNSNGKNEQTLVELGGVAWSPLVIIHRGPPFISAQ